MANATHKKISQKSTRTSKAKPTPRASMATKASKTAKTAAGTSTKREIIDTSKDKRFIIRRESTTGRWVSLDRQAEIKHLKKANEHLLNAWNAINSDHNRGRKAS